MTLHCQTRRRLAFEQVAYFVEALGRNIEDMGSVDQADGRGGGEEHGDEVPGQRGVGGFTRVQQHQSRAFAGSQTCADRINPGGHAHPF